jgi:hypothetical protein
MSGHWHAWIWESGGWHHVCWADTLAGVSLELQRLRPDVPSIRRGLTGGAVPAWVPGGYLLEQAERERRAAQVADRHSPGPGEARMIPESGDREEW